jgi:ornithine carbamoyltransferase
MKDLLRISDLAPDDLGHLLRLAERAHCAPDLGSSLLEGDTVVLYFAKPSTRTRLSFASAVARMGGVAQVVGPHELQLGRGETIEDTARVISRYARAFAIRTCSDEDVARSAAAATVPVVNALTDRHHPCQALADLLTLRRHFGHLTGLRVAYLGDGNNVAHSLIEACALAGIHLSVACPPAYQPDPDIVHAAQHLAWAHGSEIDVISDVESAVRGADAVYTDVWVSMGGSEEQRTERVAALRPYRVDGWVMGLARPGAVFLHCLPAHRGEEVAAKVIDGPQSLVFDQAENRLYTAQAVLEALVLDQLAGARTWAEVP